MNIEFDVLKDKHGGYVVIRKNADYKCHAHIKSLSGARMLISFIQNEKLPTSTYLQGSCHRLLTDEEFAKLRAKKQTYYNSKNRRNM